MGVMVAIAVAVVSIGNVELDENMEFARPSSILRSDARRLSNFARRSVDSF
jgi:hypothetical protein